jgi:CheY-like chemotaxis protein
MKSTCAVLALDCDADALISLERTLENAGFSTTTTWHIPEAMQLASSGNFEIFLVRRHPQIDVGPISKNLGNCVLVRIDDMRDHLKILDLLGRKLPHAQESEEKPPETRYFAASTS